MATLIGKRKLRNYNQTLNERDKALLLTLKQCRFLQTSQVARLFFGNATTPNAALRAASRTLAKLCGMGLVQSIERRIVGERAGCSSFVWTLKAAGIDILRLSSEISSEKPAYRKQVEEPSYIFLKHSLAIAELYTYLQTKSNLITAELEPSCWRGYTTISGSTVTLKPDLYAVTSTDGYEDYWFFEVDMDTETPLRIMRKCEQYGRYCLTGEEQERTEVFPQVVWLVPDKKRQATLKRYIGEYLAEYAELFVVITLDSLDALIRGGKEALCK